MKRQQKYTALAAFAMLAAGFLPAYADTYTATNNSPTTSLDDALSLNDTSIYDGTPSSISASDNLELFSTASTADGGDKIFKTTGDFVANDVVFKSTVLGNNVWAYTLLTLKDGTTAKFNSLTYDGVKCETGNVGVALKLGSGTLDIANSIVFDRAAGGSEANLYFQDAASTLKVGGDIEIKSKGGNPQLNVSFESQNITVGGTLKMDSSSASKRIEIKGGDNVTRNLTFGGWSVSANAGNTIRLGNAKVVNNLKFTNSAAYEFSGALLNNTWNDDFKATKLNISMEATDAENGRQTMRFTDGSSLGVENMDNGKLGTVSVVNGRLDLGLTSKIAGEKLAINGEKAVFSATSETEGDIGSVSFASFEGTKGTIVFDFAKDSCDFIKVEGAASAKSELTFLVNMTKSDFDSFLADGATELTYDIMSFQGDSADFAPTIVCSDTALRGVLNYIPNGGATTARLTITAAVPEPATVAAILGAAALAFAAYRRRK